MARTVIKVKCRLEQNDVEEICNKILNNNGYHPAEENGETVWIKGDVSLTGMKGIKVDYEQNTVKISGWIKGLVGGETALQGIAGAATKHAVKKVMNEIEQAITY